MQPIPTAMPISVRRACSRLLPALLLAVLVSACEVTFFASEGKLEPAAEARYRAVWRENTAALNAINPSLDACNVGGTKQGCYQASERMIQALQTFLTEVRSTYVPSRYRKADDSLRDGLDGMIRGYQRRNKGIATNSNADFLGGNEVVKDANRLLAAAYEHFPPDARP
jgi:hypothetical protein